MQTQTSKLRNMLDQKNLSDIDSFVRRPVTINLDQKQLMSMIKECTNEDMFLQLCRAYVKNYDNS
jgi:hypothetical protein